MHHTSCLYCPHFFLFCATVFSFRFQAQRTYTISLVRGLGIIIYNLLLFTVYSFCLSSISLPLKSFSRMGGLLPECGGEHHSKPCLVRKAIKDISMVNYLPRARKSMMVDPMLEYWLLLGEAWGPNGERGKEVLVGWTWWWWSQR